MMTPTPDRPAAAAARELATDAFCIALGWESFDNAEAEGELVTRQRDFIADRITAALLSARQAQLEDDCKAVCEGCSDGEHFDNGEGGWHYIIEPLNTKVWTQPCLAAPIRAQVAATKAVSETGEKG